MNTDKQQENAAIKTEVERMAEGFLAAIPEDASYHTAARAAALALTQCSINSGYVAKVTLIPAIFYEYEERKS